MTAFSRTGRWRYGCNERSSYGGERSSRHAHPSRLFGLDYEKFASDRSRNVPIELRRFVRNSDLVVIYAGTLGEAYNIDSVMQAAEYVVQTNNMVKFIFAGDGKYKQRIQSLSDKVFGQFFGGKVSSANLPSI
jgi:hypothetical protein